MTEQQSLSQVNVKIDKDLKEAAYKVLKDLGTTPTDLLRSVFEYIVEEKKLPVVRMLVTSDDAAFYAAVRARLRDPGVILENVDLSTLLRKE